MCQNQRGRRHSTDEQKQYLLGKEYEATKKKWGGEGRADKKSSFQSGNLISKKPRGKTVDILSEQHGIGRNTVIRSEHFANGVDAIAEASPAAKQKILSGESGITKTEVREIRNKPAEEVREIAKQIESGTYEKPAPKPVIFERVADIFVHDHTALQGCNET